MKTTHSPVRIGLIVPPASGQVPPEAQRMYPNIEFIATGLALSSVDQRGYDQVIDRVVDKAVELAEKQVQTISLMGTSLSFYRGAHFNQILREKMRTASGLPCTTMSYAILHGLNTLSLDRVVVASAYIDEVNDKLIQFLAENQITATGAHGLGITDVQAVARVSSDQLIKLCLDAWNKSGNHAQGILLSCGGLVTLDAIAEVERILGVPVVSSSPAGFWDVVGLAGADPTLAGQGRLAATAMARRI